MGKFLFVYLLLSTGSINADSEIIEGCEGEGCSCFQAYRNAKSKTEAVKTIRPFTLFEKMEKNSKILGKFDSGTMAKPVSQKQLIKEKGHYIVESNSDRKIPLKPGDEVDTLIYLGEGFVKVRSGTKWIEFEELEGAVKLKTLRQTKIENWLQISTGTLVGFTQDLPFELCLE